MGGPHHERARLTHQTQIFSEGAENDTRGRVCSPAKLDQQAQPVPLLIGLPQRAEELGADGIHLGLLDPVFQFQFRQAVPRRLYQPLVKPDLRLLENHQPRSGRCSVRVLQPTPIGIISFGEI